MSRPSEPARFQVLPGNPTAVYDREQGRVWHLQDQEEAASLCAVLTELASATPGASAPDAESAPATGAAPEV